MRGSRDEAKKMHKVVLETATSFWNGLKDFSWVVLYGKVSQVME